jgi:hypothetical protein
MSTSSMTSQAQWFSITDHLISEFDSLAAGSVIAAVARCRRNLAAVGLRGDGLALATESMARSLLSRKA